MVSLLLYDALVVLVSVSLITYFFRKRASLPLPPGPMKLPFIGNLLEMPKEQEWRKFSEWRKQYGDLVSASVFGRRYVIINSVKAAVAMLDKKSRIYSDRPIVPMGGELVGWKDALSLLNYGPRFRRHRKIFHQVMGTYSLIRNFNDIIEMEAHQLLKRLLNKPDDFLNHIQRSSGAAILRITYGYDIKAGNDPFISLVDAGMGQFSLAVATSGFLVNVLPELRHLPDWFPGAGFKKSAQAWRNTMNDMVERPFQFVKHGMANGTAEPSVVSNLLQDESKLSPEDIHDIKWTATMFYGGGYDTTVSTMHAFFKAMVLYPEIQAKAQEEIDKIVGPDRLPTVNDHERLPYVSALVLEVLRWHTSVPTALPHQVMEDDIHDGYLIPKGTIIIPNLWQLAHDPSVYKDPMSFEPARFMKMEGRVPELDPRDVIFGFGRRICPAHVSVFTSCALILAAFDITPSMKEGKPVMPNLYQFSGIISHPSPFTCNIVPRSHKAAALVNSY